MDNAIKYLNLQSVKCEEINHVPLIISYLYTNYLIIISMFLSYLAILPLK